MHCRRKAPRVGEVGASRVGWKILPTAAPVAAGGECGTADADGSNPACSSSS